MSAAVENKSVEDAEVVIVGGGPVGMGLAIELGQRGVQVAVVERYATPQQVPKGQNLTQRTMEHFHCWGAEKQLRAARTIPPEYGIGGLTTYGTLLGAYSYDWLQRDLVKQFYYTANERLPQYATEAVLRARAAEIPNVRTFYGWELERLEQDAAGVTATIRERKATGSRTLRAKYAVGCDGSRSTVREQAGIAQTKTDHDRLMVLLVFRSQELHRLLEKYPGKSYYNVLQPELEGYWKFFGRVDLGNTWFFHAPVPAGTTADNFDFLSYLHGAVGAEFAAEIDYTGFWDLRFALADTYRAQRVFIAGDAAHSHPPYGGYGVNAGLEDARNLGWKLAAMLHGWGGERLLDSYDLERRPVFKSTMDDFIAKAIETDRAFLDAHHPGRDRVGFEHAWNERARGAVGEVHAFEPNYEGSPVVARTDTSNGVDALPSSRGSHTFAARAGHHIAPAVLSNGRNVYEAFGDGFTLLAFGARVGACAAFRDAAASLHVPLAVVEDDAEAGSRYAARLVLVRPDEFVAWTSADPVVSEAQARDALARAAGR